MRRSVIVLREIPATQLPLGANIPSEPLPRGRLLRVCVSADPVVDTLYGFVGVANGADDRYYDSTVLVVRNNNDGQLQMLRRYPPASSDDIGLEITADNIYPCWFATSSATTTMRVLFYCLMEVEHK